MYVDLNSLKISLDSSVKHITKTACMHLSGVLENGIVLSANPYANIVIYKDKIEFGSCMNQELSSVSGLVYPCFFKEYGNIIYRYGSNLKCSLFGKTLDYVGISAPSVPDNEQLYNLIYPKYS